MPTLVSSDEFEQLISDTDTLLPSLANFSLSHQTLLDSFDDAGDYTATSLASNRIELSASNVFTGEDFVLVVTGSGIGPVSTLGQLEQAVIDGLATGQLDRVSVTDSSGFEFLALDVSATGYTLTSGAQTVAVAGALPNSLDQISDIANAAAALETAFDAQAQEDAIAGILAELTAFSIDSVTLTNAGQEVARIAVSVDEVQVASDAYALTVSGNFSEFFSNAVTSGAVPLPDLIVDSVVVTNPGGDEIASIRDIADLDDLSLGFARLIAQEGIFEFGTSGDDVLLGTFNDDTIDGLGGNDTIDGLGGNDVLSGGTGDDQINPGDNIGGSSGFDVIRPGTGNDIVDFGDVVSGFVTVDYLNTVTGPLTVDINGITNQGSVDKGADGTDTFIDVENPMDAGFTTGGFRVSGSGGDDVFNVTVDSEQWVSIRGFDGSDTFNISGGGLVRLNYQREGAINADLNTGVITHDGFTDQLNGTVWEIRASDGADSILGSAADESFILRQGNDTLDAGGGFDRLRYDRFGVDGITADLGTGTATGVWEGAAFTHTFSNVEWLRGSDGNDRITGDAGDNRLEGQGGTDTFVHLGGNDTIPDFDPLTETLIVRVAGLDQVQVDAAMAAAIDTADGAEVTFGIGTVMFSGLSAAQLSGANVQFADPSGVNLVPGTDGDDTLIGTPGDDLITTGDNTGSDQVFGSAGNDEIDFTGITGNPGGFVVLDYAALAGPISVAIDGGANTGTVTKGSGGTDTLTEVQAPLFAGWTTGGLSIFGTAADDTFDLSVVGQQWMNFRPGDGVDTLIVNGESPTRESVLDETGTLRLDMTDGNGVDVNLATGAIADDGFGNVEQITGNAPLWDVYGSQGDDVFVGSDNAESYRYFGGNNDLDGGAGFDRVRYDPFTVTSVIVDATAGTASGTLNNGGTFTDAISGFEWLRGSNGDDQITGEAGVDNLYQGRNGTDTFVHLGGDDTVDDFDPLTETLIVRAAGLDQAQVDAAVAGATNVAEGARVDFGATSVLFAGLNATELTTATVQFIDPGLTLPPAPPPTPPAWTVGDPHLLTLDGVGYDFHAIGEFVLLRGTSSGGFSDFEIQSRMGPVLDDLGDPLPNVSANIAIAARLGNGSEVMIDSADASPLSIDGAVQTVADGDALDVGGDLILRDGNMYTVVFAGADGALSDGDARLNVIVRDGFVDLSVQISADMAGAVEGLLGDGNGNPDDDIALTDGTVLQRPLAFEDLYGNAEGTNPNLRDDWRVTTQEQSLFTYDAGETLAGLYDPDAPGGAPTDGFTDGEVNAAQQAVEDAGLTPGTLAFENAVQDFLVAGDDRFIESSSNDVAPTTEFAGSAGALAQGEERITIDVNLADRGDQALDGAVVNFSTGANAPILGKAAAGAGQYGLSLGSNTPEGTLDAVRDYNETTDPDIGVGDALNALRLAVGLDPSFGTATAMDFIAADVDGDARVSVSDALDILRFAVGLETENAPGWVFLDDTQDLSGVDADNVVFDTGIATGPLDQLAGPIDMTGILQGSVAEV